MGGEFVFPPGIIFQPKLGQFSSYGSKNGKYHRYHTFGAYYSLLAVLHDLNPQAGDYVLLPSYLCPTMIDPFRRSKVKYEFYKMRDGLRPDLEDIDRKATQHLKAVLFIDYFGYPLKNYVAELVSQLRSKGVVAIQDNVQSWLDQEDELYGDYCFNSLRKYAPFEASVLLSREKMAIPRMTAMSSKYFWHKRYAQILRYWHIKYGLFKPDTFLNHIAMSNALYHQPGIAGMPKINRVLLDKLDFQDMGRKRKSVHRYLQQNLDLKTVLGERTEDVVPLGMSVYINNRDEKKVRLHQAGIHCPVHWKLPTEIKQKEHEYCWDLQQHELTLPVNVDLEKVDQYVTKLKEILHEDISESF